MLAAALTVLVAAGCGDDEPPALTITAPAASTHCAQGTLPRLQAGTHLVGDAEPPVPWSSTPATSGWHAAGQVTVTPTAGTLDDAALVALLEAGAVVALHDDRLAEDDVDRLASLATTAHDGRLVVARYAGDLEAPLVLVGWGVLQDCTALDEPALTEFVLRHAGLAQLHG